MEAPKPEKKVVKVPLYGHLWPVYPMKSRGKDIFRVFHRVNGERIPKTFMSLAEAKADAKSILKELYGKAGSRIHLTEDEKRDWQAAMNARKQAGIRSSLETIVRHYSDLSTIAGGEGLLTDIVRKHVASRSRAVVPIKLGDLRTAYLEMLRGRDRSERYIDAQTSHLRQFAKHVGDVLSDQITRERIQDFINSKRKVDARTKENLLEAVRAMMTFGKSHRSVTADWDEADHVVLPAVKPKKVATFTPEELKKLFAAAPENFEPVLALAAFAGIRSSEIELLEWKHIRLAEPDPNDKIIRLDDDVTEPSGRRSIKIHDTLFKWIAGPFKLKGGKVWTGSHDGFYRMQQEIAKKSGVVWKQNALRHTCISAKVALTRDVPQVAYESGNSVSVIKEHYHDLLTPSVAQAWFAVTPILVHSYRKELAKAADASR